MGSSPLRRIRSAITAITWLPLEALRALEVMPFELAATHYDDPPPDVIENVEELRRADAFREINELSAWIDVEGDTIVAYGHDGRGLASESPPELGPQQMGFPDVGFPVIRSQPEVGDGWVRFVQTAGGRVGVPVPRRVPGKSYSRLGPVSAWTTLQLVIHADGRAHGTLVSASPFPLHWIYDAQGRLIRKTDMVDVAEWYREAFGEETPWGREDSLAFAQVVASALERELAAPILRSGAPVARRRLRQGDTLVNQGERGSELFLLLMGALDVEVDGKTVAQVGAGAIVGERALLEGGKRTATLRAATACHVAVIAADRLSRSQLAELSLGRRREES